MRLIIKPSPGETIEQAYHYFDILREDGIADMKTAIEFQGYTALPGIYKDFDDYWQSISTIIYECDNKQEILNALPRGIDPDIMMDNLSLINDGLIKNNYQPFDYDESLEFANNAYNEGLTNEYEDSKKSSR